jgi:hypothetical protein
MDGDVSKKDITDLKSLAKAIKDKHVYPVKGEMNIGMSDPAVTTEIEFIETNPPMEYNAFSAHMDPYGMTTQQKQKVYTLIIHGAVKWDFTNPDSLWEQLVAEGIVVPITPEPKPALTFDPNLPVETFGAKGPQAKIITLKNVCNHTLNVCGQELKPNEVWKWHDFAITDAMKNEMQAYIKGGVLQVFDNKFEELFEPPVEGVLRTFKNISGSALAVGTVVLNHYEIFSIKMLDGEVNTEQVKAYLKVHAISEIDSSVKPSPPAGLVKMIAGPVNKPVEVKSFEEFKEHFGGFNPPTADPALNELFGDSLEDEYAAHGEEMKAAAALAKETGVPVITAQQNPLSKDEDYFIPSHKPYLHDEESKATIDKQLQAAQAVGLVAGVGKQWVTQPVHGKKAKPAYGKAVPKKKKCRGTGPLFLKA